MEIVHSTEVTRLTQAPSTTVVHLPESLTTESCRAVCQELLDAVAAGQRVVPLVCNGEGGNLNNAIEVVNLIAHLERRGVAVPTLVTSFAYSASATIFAMGTRRYMWPEASLMFHQVSDGDEKARTSNDIVSDAREICRQNRWQLERLRKRGVHRRVLRRAAKTDAYVTSAKQAVRRGCCDEIGFPALRTTTSWSIAVTPLCAGKKRKRVIMDEDNDSDGE